MSLVGVQHDHSALYRSVVQSTIFVKKKKEKNTVTQENNARDKNSPGTDVLSLQFRLLYTLMCVNHQLIRGNLPKIIEENGTESGAIKGLTSRGS